MGKKESKTVIGEWAQREFCEAKLGDQRLTSRLIRLADRLSELPESPINQACKGWQETKAAYRFFRNDKVSASEILATHTRQTAERSRSHQTVLAIQDTSYFSYTHHPKTKGLGIISRTPGKRVKMMTSQGLVMHTCFAVSAEGLPLGIFDQKIHAREPQSEELRARKKRTHNNGVAIEEKESFRWLESLRRTKGVTGTQETQIVTVCDREGDIYELFELAAQIKSSVLIRAAKDRRINQSSRYSEKSEHKLWSFIKNVPSQGTVEVEVPSKDQRPSRIAELELRFEAFTINPPRNHIRHKTETLPDLNLFAIHLFEKSPPEGTEAVEWMLLTDIPITSFDEAMEKVGWYCLRWRIEVFHKILKSGLKVEECRLGSADRLIRYLTVMSVIAWRIFFITLMGRSNPNLPCTVLLDEEEWKVLHTKIHPGKVLPPDAPRLEDAIRWIAQLGGFLARKSDGNPGPIVIWRGWKRLSDLTDGWTLAHAQIYG